MAPSKTRKKGNQPNPTHARAISQSYNNNHGGATSDFDLESDHPTTNAQLSNLAPPPPTTRTNAELNLSVLQRYDPSILSVLSIAPYAVIYTFSPEAETWEKAGVEGSLFVVQLAAEPLQYEIDVQEERYAIIVLNRLGLDNFQLELRNADDVEISDPYIILQRRTASGDTTGYSGEEYEAESLTVYGLWIFTEPPPSSTAEARTINARLMEHCASRAENSRNAVAAEINKIAQQAQHMTPTYHENKPTSPATLVGRELSIHDLFRQGQASGNGAGNEVPFNEMLERLKTQNDDNGAGHFGSMSPAFGPGPIQQMHQGGMPGGADILANLFQNARSGRQSNG